MDIPTETKRIEAHIRAAGFPAATLLRMAEGDVAQCPRGKKGQRDPRVGGAGGAARRRRPARPAWFRAGGDGGASR